MSSGTLAPAFVAQFDAEVKQAYQGMSKLQGTVRTKNGVIGSTHRFTKIGKGIAGLHTPHADVTPMGVDYTTATATLADYDAPEYSDIFQQQKINFEEKRELVMVTAGGLGRRWDQSVIDAFIASGTTNTVAKTIGGDNAMNMGKIRRIGKQFDDADVPETDRHIAWSAACKEQLLGTTKATSADYNSVRALVNGDIDSLYGFKFHLIGKRDEGGLPLSGTERNIFAWHKQAIGTAVGINMSTRIDYVANKASWLVLGKLSIGSVAIDATGISSITVDEAIAIA